LVVMQLRQTQELCDEGCCMHGRNGSRMVTSIAGLGLPVGYTSTLPKWRGD
jgi:hypothetical protein